GARSGRPDCVRPRGAHRRDMDSHQGPLAEIIPALAQLARQLCRTEASAAVRPEQVSSRALVELAGGDPEADTYNLLLRWAVMCEAAATMEPRRAAGVLDALGTKEAKQRKYLAEMIAFDALEHRARTGELPGRLDGE